MNVEEYCKFMFDNKNINNCKECPENMQMQQDNRLPCGQYHCWVALSCKQGGNNEE